MVMVGGLSLLFANEESLRSPQEEKQQSPTRAIDSIPVAAGKFSEQMFIMISTSSSTGSFRMPLHYPKYTAEQYAAMTEEQLDRLLDQYGLLPSVSDQDLNSKRQLAIGAFHWPAATATAPSEPVPSSAARFAGFIIQLFGLCINVQ